MTTGPLQTSPPTALPRWRRWLSRLEHLSLRGERRFTRLVGSSRLNPLPHTGTIGILLLVIVAVTGIYLTLFYQFGFDASYNAVAGIERHPVQRIVRAVHRYSSALLVLNTLVHGWRTMVAARFTGSRWLSWATGTVSLLLVWIGGVTGYWLIWDARAEQLNTALARLLGTSARGLDLTIDFFSSSAAGSGWLVLLFILTVHIGVTAILGGTLWLHVRRTRHRLLPPRHWIGLVVGPLVAASIAWPVGMLEPANLERLAGRVPLDPFYLFLLPAVMNWSPWAVAAVAVAVGAMATALPVMVRSTSLEPVILDVDLCTGCELCVLDCPYDALSMSEGEPSVAVLDDGRCVACGICVGSCSFDALALPGQSVAVTDVADATVVIACSRHVVHGTLDHQASEVLNEVPCAGVLHSRTIAGLYERGAETVRVVGCSPGDCSFGIGNQLAADRVHGDRAPFLGRRYRDATTTDWVSPLDLAKVLGSPGTHELADVDTRPLETRKLVGAAVVSLLTMAGVVAAGVWRWGTDRVDSELAIVVDHVPGTALSGESDPFDQPGAAPTLIVEVDGEELERVVLPLVKADRPGTALALLDIPIEPGTHDVRVVLDAGGDTVELTDGPATFSAGERVIVEALDTAEGSIVGAGEALFSETSLGTNVGCQICHSIRQGDDGVGPSLWDIGITASTRVPGQSGEDYVRAAIVDPDAYVVEGFPSGQMVPDYEERLTPDQLDALVAYLLSLQGASS